MGLVTHQVVEVVEGGVGILAMGSGGSGSRWADRINCGRRLEWACAATTA